jgi:hypothetical protein
LTAQEAQKAIEDVSKEIFDLIFEIRKRADAVIPYLGISNDEYWTLLRLENIEKHKQEAESEVKDAT